MEKRDGLKRVLPTISAMRCRIALMEGNSAAVENWLETAPDENEAFIAMERYLYLTKIRCYIAHDELDKAFSLIEATRFYAAKCDRKYIAMELSILTAIVLYRRGSDWQESFVKALEKICEYRFIPIISREGAAVFPLLEECREACCADRKINKKWFDALFDAVGKMSRRYPLYLAWVYASDNGTIYFNSTNNIENPHIKARLRFAGGFLIEISSACRLLRKRLR